MQKIDKISNENITKQDELIAFIYECICCIFMGLSLRNWNYIKIFLITLPFLVIFTLVIHESIHILFFKLFSKEAQIKIINDNFKNIYIYQSNKNVYYTRLQTIIILLAPLVLISTITLFILRFTNEQLFVPISVNGVINAMGAMTDIVLSIKLFFYKGKIFINYEKKDYITLNIYKKEENNGDSI